MGCAPPVGGVDKADVPDPNVAAAEEAKEAGAALVAEAGPRRVPADHHVLPRVSPADECPALAVDLAAAGDPNAGGVLRQDDVPPVALRRVVLLTGPPQQPRALRKVQHHAGFQQDRRR